MPWAWDNGNVVMDAHPNCGEWLRDLRADAEITQRELAEMVLADLGTIEAIEAGQLDIPTEMLGRFARVYGMSRTAFADACRDHGSAAHRRKDRPSRLPQERSSDAA